MIEKIIFETLSKNKQLNKWLGEKIRPFTLEENDTLPGLIYAYGKETGEGGKDGKGVRFLPLIVSVGATDLAEVTSHSKEVISALMNMQLYYENIIVMGVELDSFDRDYDSVLKVYFNTLTFNIHYQN